MKFLTRIQFHAKLLQLTLITLWGITGMIAYAQTCMGNTDAVVSQTGVTNPNNVLGTPNDVAAELYQTSDIITIDFTDVLSSESIFVVRWRKNSGATNPMVTVSRSSGGVSFTQVTGSPFTLSGTTYANQNITLSEASRYLSFQTTNFGDLDIDAISYTNVACSGGRVGRGSVVSGTVFRDYNANGIKQTFGSA